MTRCIAYARVSTNQQAEKGCSLAAQVAKMRAYAELYDLDLVEVIEDAGASAKTLERDGLQRALAMLKAGDADALLVLKLDRLTRSVRDLDTLISTWFADGRFALMSVGEQIDTRSAAGRLVLNVLASVSQWEREATGERTSAALQHKKANGERVGSIPLGYRLADDGVHLEEDATEQEAIAIACELREAGNSLRAIATALAERGFHSRTGRVYAATQIKRMVSA